MDCLEINEICAWSEEHGLECGESFDVRPPEWPSLHRGRYADGCAMGRETEAAVLLVAALGPWDECLVWLTSWGIWPCSEDWPKFYAWRGAQGERRSIETAPGHRFDQGEVNGLSTLIALIMENAWDAEVLCSRHGRVDSVRGTISHHETWEVFGLREQGVAGEQPAAADEQRGEG